MKAVNGSSTTPILTTNAAVETHVKLLTAWTSGAANAETSAGTEMQNAPAMENNAAPEAHLRDAGGTKAPKAAASKGNRGMNQMDWTAVMIFCRERTGNYPSSPKKQKRILKIL
jgi:hypothetical protein